MITQTSKSFYHVVYQYLCVFIFIEVYYKNMKTFIKLLLLSPMIFTSVGCKKKADPKPVDVVVISGQSNGVGCTYAKFIKDSVGHAKYQEYMKGYEGIQIAFDSWTKDEGPKFYSQNKSKDDTFTKVMLGQGNSLVTFGPEIGISDKLHEKYAGKLFLIKFACGASNLKDDWARRNSPMYSRFVKYVQLQMENLKKMGYLPTIKAMCWMQGEGDSWDGYYQDYYDNTKLFVTSLREDLKSLAGDKDFPFIDAGISNSTEWKYYRQVNDAKKQFASESENNIYIDTIAAGLHVSEEPHDKPDLCHYDSESQIQLGQLFAEQFEQFLDKVE